MSALPAAAAPLADIGETFTQRARFSEAGLRAFATSVHDHNPLHHDPAAAPRALVSRMAAQNASRWARSSSGSRQASGDERTPTFFANSTISEPLTW